MYLEKNVESREWNDTRVIRIIRWILFNHMSSRVSHIPRRTRAKKTNKEKQKKTQAKARLKNTHASEGVESSTMQGRRQIHSTDNNYAWLKSDTHHRTWDRTQPRHSLKVGQHGFKPEVIVMSDMKIPVLQLRITCGWSRTITGSSAQTIFFQCHFNSLILTWGKWKQKEKKRKQMQLESIKQHNIINL